MGIYVGDAEIKGIYLGDTLLKEVYLGDTKIRPTYKPRTFTISRTEQSNMSSGWTYSDDAAGLTAGDGDFDDFFGYSAVLLNTSGVETAEMTQSGGVFTGAMTTLGNITSGDNVMIKFPVRGIKMTKSGSTVTLSITDGLGRESEGYQYYAHSTGTLSNPGTPKDVFYLGAYMGYPSSNVLKSWSGQYPVPLQTQPTLCSYAKNNGTGYNISGFYQRMYIAALYMMKYGNPNSQSAVGMGYVNGSDLVPSGGTNSQTNATYGTTSKTKQIKLFGLEDRWGNYAEWIGGMYVNSTLYTSLSGWSGYLSGGENTGVYLGGTQFLRAIVGNNKGMFAPQSSISSNSYYCDHVYGGNNLGLASGYYNSNTDAGIFWMEVLQGTSSKATARLMYL